jgi:hypothetical protein
MASRHRKRRHTKKLIAGKRRNRRSTRRMDHEDHESHTLEDIIDHLQTGSGLRRSITNSYSRQYTLRLINTLVGLGWSSTFANAALSRMDDQMLSELPDRIFIKRYFDILVRRQPQMAHESLLTLLLRMGFRPDIAAKLEHMLEPLRDSSYTDAQIFDTAIYYVLGQYSPIGNPGLEHLIDHGRRDVWFQYIHESKPISIYNMTQKLGPSSTDTLAKAVTKMPLGKPGSKHYFHATSWKSSLDIMDGVDRLQGRPCLDFGVYPGFYMSETLNDCVEWATKKRILYSNEVAIMIFAVPSPLPPHLTFLELRDSTWASVTLQSRICKQERELKSIKSIDLLYGDMVRNPIGVKNGVESPIAHSPPKKQLVAKTDVAEKFIDDCLVGCVYLPKTHTPTKNML